MEFRVLGDVEARSNGERLEIGAARQRCVLAALLIDVNRPVPTDQLIDRVWADDLPHRARNTLAGYLSRLRQVVATDGDVEISREPGGYVLKADAATVDVHRFSRLSAAARAAKDPIEADRLFTEALALWQGEPFASLDTPWLNDVRTALEADRLAVVLDRNDAGLRAGRHGELLPAIALLAQDNPLDERVAGQLMLAQFRGGRQADALETFRRIRERLVEELGADPGPALRLVHQRILDGDPGYPGAEPPPTAAPVAAPVVITRPHAGLPRRATSFIGREGDVDGVRAALAEGPLVTLTGVGGVGKTRLALEVAAREEEHFSDGVWLCELAPLDEGSAVTHAVSAALHLQQRQGLDIDATVIEYLQGRQLLLVLDNCEHVLDSAATLADNIVRHCPRVVVLATSRESLGVEGERLVPVPPLGVEDATRLFAERARAGRPDFDLDHEPIGAVAEICRRLDGLPLAIELAAARMRVMSSLEVARRLDKQRLLTGRVRDATPRQQSLAATIDWSYRLLTESEQELFGRLSVFAGGFDLDAAHGVCGADGDTEDDTLDGLTGLLDKSMVVLRSGIGATRYGLLETLRAYGRDRLRERGFHDECATRHVAYYTELAEWAAAGVQGPDERSWVERMLPDYDNLRTAYEHALAASDVESTLRLVASLSEFVHLRIGFESSGWAEHLIPRTDPQHLLYVAIVGYAARGAWNRGEFDHADALAGLAAGRFPGRGNGRVAYPGDVAADVALYRGDAAAALAHYGSEVERARAEDDPIRLVWTLFYVSICHAALRRPDDGLAAAEESLRVAEPTENPTARSMARYALGLVLKKSEPERALTLFDEAAELAAAVQNFWWLGIALMEGAATRAVHGEQASAARALIEVLEHWDRVGDWSQQWLNLRYVARFFVRVGADDDAVAVHHALVRAGRLSPLSEAPEPGAAALTGVEAVARARAGLARYV